LSAEYSGSNGPMGVPENPTQAISAGGAAGG